MTAWEKMVLWTRENVDLRHLELPLDREAFQSQGAIRGTLSCAAGVHYRYCGDAQKRVVTGFGHDMDAACEDCWRHMGEVGLREDGDDA